MDAALVNDEVGRKTLSLEVRSQAGSIVALIPRSAPLSVVLPHLGVERVVVGDIRGEAADLLWGTVGAGDLENLSKLLGSQGKVVIPAEPATVGGINVQVDVVKLKSRNGVSDTLTVDVGGTGAERDAKVGNEVAERIGLKNNGEAQVLGLRKLLSVGLDELLLVAVEAVLLAGELTGGLTGGAVTVWEVVENETNDLLLASPLLDAAGLSNGVVDSAELREARDPDEGAELLHLENTESVLEVELLKESVVGLSELAGPLGVDEERLAHKGVGGVNILGRVRLAVGGNGGSQSPSGEGGEKEVGAHGDDVCDVVSLPV